MSETEIGVEAARAKLGELVDNATIDGTTTYLTRRGRRYAAIVPPAGTLIERVAAAQVELGELKAQIAEAATLADETLASLRATIALLRSVTQPEQ